MFLGELEQLVAVHDGLKRAVVHMGSQLRGAAL